MEIVTSLLHCLLVLNIIFGLYVMCGNTIWFHEGIKMLIRIFSKKSNKNTQEEYIKNLSSSHFILADPKKADSFYNQIEAIKRDYEKKLTQHEINIKIKKRITERWINILKYVGFFVLLANLLYYSLLLYYLYFP